LFIPLLASAATPRSVVFLGEPQMASVCELCGKHPSWGMSISHSHIRTKKRWNPNIQRVRALVNGAAKRMNVCTGCIKSGKIVKAGH
jgi:large subunit ribosomal protein L28